MKTYSTQKGSVLIFALIILSLVTLAAVGITTVSVVERKASTLTGQSTGAFQLADTGLEVFLQQLYKGENVQQDDPIASIGDALQSRYSDLYTISDCSTDDGTATFTFEHKENTDQSFKVIAIDDNGEENLLCSDPLASISELKVVGINKNTARAIRVDIPDSVERGLVAFWDFEDSAQSKALYGASLGAGSPTSTDVAPGSKNVAVLCPCEEGNSGNPGECGSGANDFCAEEIKHTDGGTGFDHIADWVAGVPVAPQATGIDGGSYGNEALSFHGDQYLYVEDNESLVFDDDTSFSVSFWIKPESSTVATIISKGEFDESEEFFEVGLESGKVVARISSGNGIEETSADGASVGSGWTHVAVVFDRSDNEIIRYVNGEESGDRVSIDGIGDIETSKPLIIGAGNEGESTWFDGAIDDMRLYNRVLASSEVQKLYELGQ